MTWALANEVTGTLQKDDVLEIAVSEHSRLVYRVAYSVLRNHHDAEDATQETFLRVLRYRRHLADVQNQRTWLAQIAWRVAVGRRKKVREVPLEEVNEAIVQLHSSDGRADEIAMASQRNDLLCRVIGALPKDLRDAITLSTTQELSSGDIAAILKIPESAVRSRTFRARQILKEKLAAILEKKHET